MRDAELVGLLEKGIERGPYRWADLGAGEGNFTRALATLLGPGAHIVAVDKDGGALRSIGGGVETRVADFTRPLDVHDLDGVVMANSLHYVRNKPPVLEAVRTMLKPDGRLNVLEYETDRGNLWVPHPFSFQTRNVPPPAAGVLGDGPNGTVPTPPPPGR